MQDFETLTRWHENGVELSTDQYNVLVGGIAQLKAEIEELRENDARENLRVELLEEQVNFARDLVRKVQLALRHTTARAIKQAINTAIDDAMFEY